MDTHELIALAAMGTLVILNKHIARWFTAERGIGDGKNGWV